MWHTPKKKKNWKPQKALKNLILDNCFSLGRNPKFTNHKMNQYLYGTRENIEMFKLHEVRYILLRIAPFIKTLFINHQQNYFEGPETIERKKVGGKGKTKFQFLESRIFIGRPNLRIVFATTNPSYTEIVQTAASLCQMTAHVGKWLTGSITSTSIYGDHLNMINPWLTSSLEKVSNYFTHKYHFGRKKSRSQSKSGGWQDRTEYPSLVIVPDISNSFPILHESQKIGTPVIGLTNSTDMTLVDYPIFGNNHSIHMVHFFCHFLAILIGKEIMTYSYLDQTDVNQHVFNSTTSKKKSSKLKKGPAFFSRCKRKNKKKFKTKRWNILFHGRWVLQKKIKRFEQQKYENSNKFKALTWVFKSQKRRVFLPLFDCLENRELVIPKLIARLKQASRYQFSSFLRKHTKLGQILNQMMLERNKSWVISNQSIIKMERTPDLIQKASRASHISETILIWRKWKFYVISRMLDLWDVKKSQFYYFRHNSFYYWWKLTKIYEKKYLDFLNKKKVNLLASSVNIRQIEDFRNRIRIGNKYGYKWQKKKKNKRKWQSRNQNQNKINRENQDKINLQNQNQNKINSQNQNKNKVNLKNQNKINLQKQNKRNFQGRNKNKK
jgi:ribosomal protein S2